MNYLSPPIRMTFYSTQQAIPMNWDGVSAAVISKLPDKILEWTKNGSLSAHLSRDPFGKMALLVHPCVKYDGDGSELFLYGNASNRLGTFQLIKWTLDVLQGTVAVMKAAECPPEVMTSTLKQEYNPNKLCDSEDCKMQMIMRVCPIPH